MPNDNARNKRDHEDRALAILIKTITDQGRSATVVGRPDGDPSTDLTIDALVDVDGTVWALDHIVVSRDSRLPSAQATTENYLREPLCERSRFSPSRVV